MRLAGAILTGGAGSRMGGVAKGTLPGLDGRPLAARLAALLSSMDVPYVLVGRPSEHASLGLPAIPDAWPGRGPLGGIATACAWASGQPADAVLVLACDLPHLTRALLDRLAAAPPDAPAVIFARADGHFAPLPGRFAVSLGPLAAGCLAPADPHRDTSLRGLLAAAGGPLSLPLTPAETPLLDDWDTPAQVASPPGPLSDFAERGRRGKT